MKPVHGAPRPTNVPKDMQEHPPIACQFKVGDSVFFKNDNGVTFSRKVLGYAPKPSMSGRFVYINSDSWWFPVSPASLSIRNG